MTKEEIIEEIIATNCDPRKHRSRLMKLIESSKNNVKELLEIAFEHDNFLSFRGGRVLEFICKQTLVPLITQLDYFTENISTVKHHSTRREVAKICELIASEYDSEKSSLIRDSLTNKHKERIITACFDWLIGNEKVAIHAYSMQTLFVFGKEIDWIHNELRQVLVDNMAYGSAGYVSRAKRILKAIA